MRWRSVASIAVAALFVAACGDDAPAPTTPAPTLPAAIEPVTFTGIDGIVSTITDMSRIISLNGDLTEVIYALGLGDQVVAVDLTATYPPEISSLPKVGLGMQLAAETVLAFKPTIVIGDQQIQPPESIQQLRDAGVPVVIIETQTTLAGIETKITQVAEILGVPEEGRRLADRVNREIEEATQLAARAAEQVRVAFVYTRAPQEILLFGRGTVTQAMIEGANAVDAISASGVVAIADLTPEALVAAAPDVIILPELGVGRMGGLDAVAELPGVAETPAGQSRSFLVYEDGFFLNFGPRAGQALRMLVLDLYPELEG